MIESPFTIFEPYADTFRVVCLRKEDQINSDARAADVLGVHAVAAVNQVHGTRTIRVNAPQNRDEDADGMITNTKNMWLTIRMADCQTFVFYVPGKEISGVLHAGWRGIEANAIGAFFNTLKDEWNVDAKDVLVGAGPSLCMKHSEFTDPQKELPSVPNEFKHERLVDLRGAADWQLTEAGVLPQNIERMPQCPACSPDQHWTYRGGDKQAVIDGWRDVLACELL